MTTKITQVLYKNLIWAAPLAGIVSAITNTILYFVFSSFGIMDSSIVIPEKGPITLIPIIQSSTIPILIAAIVYAILGATTKNPYKIFRVISIVLVLLSFMNPFLGIPGITTGMAMALNVMHIVVAASAIVIFRKFATK